MAMIPLTVFIVAVAFIVLTSPAVAEDVWWGNTNISGTEEYTDLTIHLDGNLTVEPGGSLTVTSSDLIIGATSPSQYMITVEEGGTLIFDGVNISSEGGTYGMRVSGLYSHVDGELTGLEAYDAEMEASTGLVVLGNAEVHLEGLLIENPEGFALFAEGKSTVAVSSCDLYGLGTVVGLNGSSQLDLLSTLVRAVAGSDLIVVSDEASLTAELCTFDSDDVAGTDVANQALFVYGPNASAYLDTCTIMTLELMEVQGGHAELVDCQFTRSSPRPLADLLTLEADVLITNMTLDDVTVSGGTLELIDTLYSRGSVSGGTEMVTVGSVPPLSTIGEDVRLKHYYWVDFHLFNASGSPAEGMDLYVLTSEGDLVLDAVSGPMGYVLKVPIASWTMDGDVFEYEPSHRVEFAGPDFQITNLQVYGNDTVTLKDLVDNRDLALTTSSVQPSTSAPRENRTFDLVIDGDVLITYTWSSGQTFIDLYIDGEFYERQVVPLTSDSDVRFRDLNLTAGHHRFRIEVDPTNDVEEINEDGNNVVGLVLDVAPESGGGDLVDLTIELQGFTDSQGSDGDTLVPGVIIVNYKVRATNSKTFLRNVEVAVQVDGVTDKTDRVDLLVMDGADFVHEGRFDLNLPRGEYLITVIVDPMDEIDEEFEHNNDDSRAITLDPDANSAWYLDPACCSAIAMVGMIIAISAITTYAQRRQRKASEGMAAETVEYPQSTWGGTSGSGMQTTYAPQEPRPPGKVPTTLDSQWSVETVEYGALSGYGSDWDTESAERITSYRAPSLKQKERYKATHLNCPRCNGKDIVGFSDGSAKCQSCKKIFYPGRRYG